VFPALKRRAIFKRYSATSIDRNGIESACSGGPQLTDRFGLDVRQPMHARRFAAVESKSAIHSLEIP